MLSSAPASPPSPARDRCGPALNSARRQRDTVWAQLYQAKQSTPKPPGGPSSPISPTPAPTTTISPSKASSTTTSARRNTKRPSSRSKSCAAQSDFQAFGIAGLVVAYTNLDDDEQAYDENQRLSTEMRTALDKQSPAMAALLSDALDELADRAL